MSPAKLRNKNSLPIENSWKFIAIKALDWPEPPAAKLTPTCLAAWRVNGFQLQPYSNLNLFPPNGSFEPWQPQVLKCFQFFSMDFIEFKRHLPTSADHVLTQNPALMSHIALRVWTSCAPWMAFAVLAVPWLPRLKHLISANICSQQSSMVRLGSNVSCSGQKRSRSAKCPHMRAMFLLVCCGKYTAQHCFPLRSHAFMVRIRWRYHAVKVFIHSSGTEKCWLACHGPKSIAWKNLIGVSTCSNRFTSNQSMAYHVPLKISKQNIKNIQKDQSSLRRESSCQPGSSKSLTCKCLGLNSLTASLSENSSLPLIAPCGHPFQVKVAKLTSKPNLIIAEKSTYIFILI